MKHWKKQNILKILIGLIVFFMVGCPNNLVDTIDEEVTIVVTPPSVVSIYPTANAVSIPVDMDDVLITFTKQIESSSVNSSTFITKDSDGNAVSGTYSVSNDTIAFNPSSNLSYSTIYTITAKSVILDIDGNPMSDEFSWDFTTEEAPPSELPQVIHFRIDYGRSATNKDTVLLDISAINAEGVIGIMEFHYRAVGDIDWSSWIELTDGGGTVEDIVIPVVPGVFGTFYFEAEVRNSFGNKSLLASDNIDYEVEAPTITATSPENNSSDYPSNGGIVSISFSEEMNPNTIRITADGVDGNFYLMEGSTRIEGVAVQYLIVDSNGIYPDNTALLTGLELQQGVDYMVYLEATATDAAGNYLESEYSWFFRTGDAIDNDPPVGTILLDTDNFPVKHPTDTATNDVSAILSIFATDTYNAPYGMLIWGDNNDILLPAFEDAAVWEPYSTTKAWTLSSGDGHKYIYYKFMDAASNETETPYRLKLSLDTTDPIMNGVYIDSDAAYTNDSDRMVNLTANAIDATSGLAKMRVIVDGTALELDPLDEDGDADLEWGVWIPSMAVQLSIGDGVKNIGVEVRDFVGLPLVPVPIYDTIILDLTAPDISFYLTDQLEINSPTQQTGTYSDTNPIATYLWEQVSGPGTVVFSDFSVEAPTLSADIEGDYTLKVTVTDAAGNSSFDSVNLIWDVTAPGTPAGAAPVVTVNNYYSTTYQPEWSWTALSGANFYRVSFAAIPDWDSYDPTGQTGYIETNITAFTPTEGLSEGIHTLKVKGYDNARNSTAVGSEIIFVDTVYPFISNDGNYYLKNGTFPIDNTTAVTDSGGSGIASVLWSKYAGTGTLSFSAADALVTTISADADDYYTITLTVTDSAGNVSTAYYGLGWDTTGPTNPVISAPSATPDSTPTWVWESSGDGTGKYRYEFIDKNGTSSGWISADYVYSFTAPDQLAGQYTLTLNLQDQDEVGNWSGTSIHVINVDTTNIVAPFITAPSLTNDSTPTWSWTSGAGSDPSATYQWKLEIGGIWSANTSQTSYTPGSALSHGNNTLYVQEYYNSAWRESSKIINVDLVAPGAPSVSMTQTGTSTDTTNDTTPNFTWTTSGGGAGVYQYQYQINSGGYSAWSADTTSTTYTYATALADTDTFDLQVQERDQAGNWSSAGLKSITIDRTAPAPVSISIDSAAAYTTDLSVDLAFSATGSPTEMQFCNYSPTLYWGTWSSWENYSTSKTWSLTSSDETKYAMVKFKDAAGNVSGYIYDTITLDTTAPSFTSFSINNTSTSTSSYSITLNSNVTGASTMYVKNGVGSYVAYSYSASKSWNLNTGYGVKKVSIYYEDAAGNTTGVYSDVIHYGQSNLYNSTKGETSNGYIYLNYDSYGTESGTNTYYTYFHTAPTSTPATGYALLKTSTSTAPLFTGIPKGTLYYIYIMVYNNTSGLGLSDRFGTSMIAFTSNITVVYDSSQSSDVTTANNIKALLENYNFDTTTSGVTGTMPVWTVTLLPENQIPNLWTTIDDRYIIYGDPIIITPHASYPYSYSNRARNLSHRSYNTGLAPTTTSGKAGVVAMGYGGNLFLYRLRLNPSWHWSGTMADAYQYPTEIGYGYSTGFNTADVSMYQWTAGNSVWSSPLASTNFNGGTSPLHNVTSQVTYSTAPLAIAGTTDSYFKRWSVYRATDTNPTFGYIYGGDYPNTHYFPVIRQGRFLQFGFQTMPNRSYTGKVYFVNLIARMDNY